MGMELRPFLKTHTYTMLNLEQVNLNLEKVNFQLDYPTGLPKFCIFKGGVLVLWGTEACLYSHLCALASGGARPLHAA